MAVFPLSPGPKISNALELDSDVAQKLHAACARKNLLPGKVVEGLVRQYLGLDVPRNEEGFEVRLRREDLMRVTSKPIDATFLGDRAYLESPLWFSTPFWVGGGK